MKKKLALALVAVLAAISAIAFSAPKVAQASCSYHALAGASSNTTVDGQTVTDYLYVYGGEANGCAEYDRIFWYSRFATTGGLVLDTGSNDNAYAYVTDTSIATDAPKYYKQFAGKWGSYSGCIVGTGFCTSGQYATPWTGEDSNFANGDNTDDLYQFFYPSQVEDSANTHFNLVEATVYDCLIC